MKPAKVKAALKLLASVAGLVFYAFLIREVLPLGYWLVVAFAIIATGVAGLSAYGFAMKLQRQERNDLKSL